MTGQLDEQTARLTAKVGPKSPIKSYKEVTVKITQKVSVSNKCCAFELKKSIMVSTKILSSTTVFNIDNNNKCFLSSNISILE